MPDNVLFILVFDALPDHGLELIDADLPQDEADLVLEQAALALVMLLGEEQAEGADGLLALPVPQQVHQPVLLEQAQLVRQQQA